MATIHREFGNRYEIDLSLAYFSARLARHVPRRALRMGVVILGLGMAGWFFWKTHGL